jgi:hypothetical protein
MAVKSRHVLSGRAKSSPVGTVVMSGRVQPGSVTSCRDGQVWSSPVEFKSGPVALSRDGHAAPRRIESSRVRVRSGLARSRRSYPVASHPVLARRVPSRPAASRRSCPALARRGESRLAGTVESGSCRRPVELSPVASGLVMPGRSNPGHVASSPAVPSPVQSGPSRYHGHAQFNSGRSSQQSGRNN